MKYPSLTNYIEAVSNLEDRLRTLTDITPMFDKMGEPIFYASKGYVTFSVCRDHRVVSLKCFTSVQGAERLLLRVENGSCSLFEFELFVFNDTHVGDYYSIVIEDFAIQIDVKGLDSGDCCTEGLFPFCDNGLWGYRNHLGEVAIAAIYQEVGEFSEGRAVVTKNGLQGLINREGTTILDTIFDEVSWDGSSIAYVERGGKWGCYDRSARQIVACKYDWMGEFSTSLLLVKSCDKYGYLDLQGNEAIPLVYDWATSFDENGFAAVKICGREVMINTDGVIEM